MNTPAHRSQNRVRLGRTLFIFVAMVFVGMVLPGALRLPEVSGLIGPPGHAEARMRTEKMTLVTSSGRHAFMVEITESEADKALGLMYRRSLGKRAGMLFRYDREFEITMWMKNTYISLDMIFIKKNGTVHRIERATEPFSEDVIASKGNVAAVLEVAAGVSDEIGLKPGDRVEHPFFTAP